MSQLGLTRRASESDLSVSLVQQDALSELIRCDVMHHDDILQMLDDALSWIARTDLGKHQINALFQHHLREVIEASDLDQDLQVVFINLVESIAPSPF